MNKKIEDRLHINNNDYINLEERLDDKVVDIISEYRSIIDSLVAETRILQNIIDEDINNEWIDNIN